MTAPPVDPVPRDIDVQTVIGPGGCTTTVTGDVDTAGAPRLGERLLELLGRPDVTDVELDLTAVTYLGAAGLRTLVIAHQTADRTGRRLTVRCGDSRAVLRSLQLTGLSTVLTIVGP